MFISREKKDKNIAEYILYMWQVEDLTRAYSLDIEHIKSNIIPQYKIDSEQASELCDWYDNIIQSLINEKKQSSGHMQALINIVNDVNDMHIKLLNSPEEVAYKHVYQATQPYIAELKAKMKDAEANDVDVCLSAVYSQFLLKLQGKDVSEATAEAIKAFSNLMAMLSAKYKEEQEKDTEELN